jgi:uncharacterized SAM-dependent methyltransferase
MKSFNLFFVSISIAVFFSTPIYAQNIGKDFKDKTPEERAKFQTDMMKNKLSLKADQEVKVQAINLNYAEKFDPIIKSNDNKLSRFMRAMDLQKAKDAELKKVFTAEQYKQYEAIESELKAKMKGKF